MGRGGKREGAGRKKSEPTKRITVPKTLVPEVEELIFNYKNGNEKPLSGLINDFVNMYPEYAGNREVMTPLALLFEDWEAVKKLPRQQRKAILKMLQKN